MKKVFRDFAKEIHRLGPVSKPNKHAGKHRVKHPISRNLAQDSSQGLILSLDSKDSNSLVKNPVQNVKNSPNTRQVMAKKAAKSEAQICAECGNPRWIHYCALRHNFQKPKAVA